MEYIAVKIISDNSTSVAKMMSKRSVFSGNDPVKSIEDDYKRLPAGIFLINGWLSHTFP